MRTLPGYLSNLRVVPLHRALVDVSSPDLLSMTLDTVPLQLCCQVVQKHVLLGSRHWPFPHPNLRGL